MNLSKLGLGFLRIKDYKELNIIIDYAISKGINYFDCCGFKDKKQGIYYFNKSIKKYNRSNYILCAKSFIEEIVDNKINKQEIQNNFKKIIYRQLNDFNTNYFDIYMFHSLSSDKSYNNLINYNLLEILIKLKRIGIIKNIGFSFHGNNELLKKLLNLYTWDYIQLSINWVDWFYGDNKMQYDIITKNNIPCIAMSPLKAGHLALLNKESSNYIKTYNSSYSIPSWSYRFLNSLPKVNTILGCFNSITEINDNINSLHLPKLNQQEFTILNNTANIYLKNLYNSCINCSYCTKFCKQSIPIPQILETYGTNLNILKFNSLFYDKIITCTNCKICEYICPEHIEISKILRKIMDND